MKIVIQFEPGGGGGTSIFEGMLCKVLRPAVSAHSSPNDPQKFCCVTQRSTIDNSTTDLCAAACVKLKLNLGEFLL